MHISCTRSACIILQTDIYVGMDRVNDVHCNLHDVDLVFDFTQLATLSN